MYKYLSTYVLTLVRSIARAVRAKGVLDSQRRKRRSTILQQYFRVVRGSKVRVAVDARIVIEKRNG